MKRAIQLDKFKNLRRRALILTVQMQWTHWSQEKRVMS